MAIYCINLKHRQDRKYHSLQQFKNLGIPEYKVHYLPFEKDPRGGVYGCFDSHMKVWKDFFMYHPNQTYAVVFEDDFVSPEHGRPLLQKASVFIQEHYNEVDLLNLHDMCVTVEESDQPFVKGYGLSTGAYIVTRRYIQNIYSTYGSLPEPNGRHIDLEININAFDKDNRLYSEHLFFTKQSGFLQRIDKSDNYINKMDEVLRTDVNQGFKSQMKMLRFLRKHLHIKDKNLKRISYYTAKLICHQ